MAADQRNRLKHFELIILAGSHLLSSADLHSTSYKPTPSFIHMVTTLGKKKKDLERPP